MGKNKALERKSQMLIQKMSVGPSLVEINIDDNEEENSHVNEYIQKLNRQIQELEDGKSALSVQVKDINEDYHNEKERNNQLKAKIEIYKKELEQAKSTVERQEKSLQLLAKTSEAA